MAKQTGVQMELKARFQIKTTLKLIVSALAVFFYFSGAQANPLLDQVFNPYFTLNEPEIKLIEETSLPQMKTMEYFSDCSDLPSKDPKINGVNIGVIINIGKEVWKIIEANKPSVNVRTTVAHALPQGILCWDHLENWRPPVSKTYGVSYKNLWGSEVVHFDFRVIYTYGGQYDGQGQYLSNISVFPTQLDVSWGYKFNAEVNVPLVVNLGTQEDPLAGSEINLHWQVDTVMKSSQSSATFFVQGDGLMNEM